MIKITPKDDKLLNDKKVKEYLKKAESEIFKSLDIYKAVEKTNEAIALGIPFSYEFNKDSKMIDVVLHRNFYNE